VTPPTAVTPPAIAPPPTVGPHPAPGHPQSAPPAADRPQERPAAHGPAGSLSRRLGPTTYASQVADVQRPAAPPWTAPDVADHGSRRRLWLVILAGVVVPLIAAGAAVFVFHPAALFGPKAAASPSAVVPPAPPPSPVLAPAPSDAPVPAADAIAAALRGPLADQRLGSHVGVQVTDAATGQSL